METRGRLTIVIVLLISTLGCASAFNAHHSQYEKALSASTRSKDRMLKNLATALSASAHWARINYHQACFKGVEGDLIFPVVNTVPPINSGRGLESVREVFRNASNVRISEDKSGLVQITIGKVSGAILDTKIPRLKLNQRAQFNPGGLVGAIPAIQQSPEYMAAFKKLGLERATILYSGVITPPLENLPHLPPVLNNVTVGGAYGLIAKTFGGVVAYGECTKPDGERLVDTMFYHLD